MMLGSMNDDFEFSGCRGISLIEFENLVLCDVKDIDLTYYVITEYRLQSIFLKTFINHEKSSL